MLNPAEAKTFLEQLLSTPTFKSPHGPLLPVDVVLKLIEPLCVGGFVIVIQRDQVGVQLPAPAPVPPVIPDLKIAPKPDALEALADRRAPPAPAPSSSGEPTPAS